MVSFFITGTGTSVGKTQVSKLLFSQMSKKVEDIAYFKPIQTGAKHLADGLLAPDVLSVYGLAVAGNLPRQITSSYLFEPACSPHLAAELAGKEISLAKIAADIDQLQRRFQVVLIEGAGGLLVPINKEKTMLDLIQKLNLPAILVFNNDLGAINQALMSINTLKARKVEIAAIISNELSPRNSKNALIREDNLEIIERFSGEKVSGTIFYDDPFPEKGLEAVVSSLLAGGV